MTHKMIFTEEKYHQNYQKTWKRFLTDFADLTCGSIKEESMWMMTFNLDRRNRTNHNRPFSRRPTRPLALSEQLWTRSAGGWGQGWGGHPMWSNKFEQVPDGHTPSPEQTNWYTWLETLPSRKLSMREVNMQSCSICHINGSNKLHWRAWIRIRKTVTILHIFAL